MISRNELYRKPFNFGFGVGVREFASMSMMRLLEPPELQMIDFQ